MKRVLLLFFFLFIPYIINSFNLKIISPRLAMPVITDSAIIEIDIAIDTNEFSELYTTVFSDKDTAVVNLYPIENVDSNVWKFYASLPSIPHGLYSLAVWFNAYRDTQYNAIDYIDSFPSSFKFIQFSDPHVGYSDNTSKYIGETVRDINFINPDFAILTGDFAEKGNHPEWYEEALDSLKRLRVPVYVISGNHDWYNWMYLPTDENNYLEYVNPFANYSFEFGNSFFILLDSGEDDLPSFTSNCYGLTDAQIVWTDSVLSRYQEDKTGFIFMHGPFWDDENNENRYGKEQFIELCSAYNVDMVFCGHVHKNKFFDKDGNRYTGDIYPISGTKFIQTTTSGKSDYENCGYRLIRIQNDSILNYSTDPDGDGTRNFATSLMLSSIDESYVLTTDSLNAAIIVRNNSNETFKNTKIYIDMNPDTTYKVSVGNIISSNNGHLIIRISTVEPNSLDSVVVSPIDYSGLGRHMYNISGKIRIVPNPFNSKCKIYFDRKNKNIIKGKIYSLIGREVKRFETNGDFYIWNGCDNEGKVVPQGSYMIVIDGEREFTKKFFKMK